MVRFKFLIPVLFITSSILFAQEYPVPEVHNFLKNGIKKIVEQDYAGADSLFNKLNIEYPSLPLGKIYLAASHIARSFDYGEQFETDKIETLLNDSYKQAKDLLDKDPKNVWYNYFTALAEGYTAYFEAIQENYFSAMSSGLSAVNYYEDCIKIKPGFYEAFIAIGTYKYWKSRKTEFLHWLPFVSDERIEGVELLETAINNNSYNTHLAINSLIWIYIDQKRFGDAVKLAEATLKTNPWSRIFKWSLGRAYEDLDRKKSITVYNEILQSYPPEGISNHLNVIVLKHKIAQQHEKLGEKKRAIDLCNEILAVKDLSPFVKAELDDRLRRVEEMRRNLMK